MFSAMGNYVFTPTNKKNHLTLQYISILIIFLFLS